MWHIIVPKNQLLCTTKFLIFISKARLVLLSQDIMKDPCVAADGFTYDRNAIETWLKEKDISPMTSLPLAHKNLLPNYALLSAILDWKSR